MRARLSETSTRSRYDGHLARLRGGGGHPCATSDATSPPHARPETHTGATRPPRSAGRSVPTGQRGPAVRLEPSTRDACRRPQSLRTPMRRRSASPMAREVTTAERSSEADRSLGRQPEVTAARSSRGSSPMPAHGRDRRPARAEGRSPLGLATSTSGDSIAQGIGGRSRTPGDADPTMATAESPRSPRSRPNFRSGDRRREITRPISSRARRRPRLDSPDAGLRWRLDPRLTSS